LMPVSTDCWLNITAVDGQVTLRWTMCYLFLGGCMPVIRE